MKKTSVGLSGKSKGSLAPSKKATSTKLASYPRTIGKNMKSGGKMMKNCKSGC